MVLDVHRPVKPIAMSRTRNSIHCLSQSRDFRYGIFEIVSSIRQNHALEHATIAILLTRLNRRVRLVGRAGLTGFDLYGNVPSDILEDCANEALRRLHKGEDELAVSPICGTNLVVAGLAAGIAGVIAGRGCSGMTKLSRVLAASTAAAIVSQPLGTLAQKHITTSPHIDNISAIKVTKRGDGVFTRHNVEVIRI